MKKAQAIVSVMAILLMAFLSVTALAVTENDAEVYFCSDSNGVYKVTQVQEGDKIFIAVYDPVHGNECTKNRIAPDLKIFDPKTGAYLVWNPAVDPYNPGSDDYLEETGNDTNLFVSVRAFQVGTRESYSAPQLNTHVVSDDFQWGNYGYVDGVRGTFDCAGGFEAGGEQPGPGEPPEPPGPGEPPSPFEAQGLQPQMEQIGEACGRFENMDTLVGMYQDPANPEDVATTMAKIIDTESVISWDEDIYPNSDLSAKVTVVDHDENVNCNVREYVPVFIIVNPGSWTGVAAHSPTNFCELKNYGGVDPSDSGSALDKPIRWYNIYDSGLGDMSSYVTNNQDLSAGGYYLQYPQTGVVTFNTMDPNGYARAVVYAQETGPNTGEFTYSFNTLLTALGFTSFGTGDVLAAYYLDPNDFDDFALATANIEQNNQLSTTRFTDADQSKKNEFSIGQDDVYTWVLDYNANTDTCAKERVQVHICDPHGEDDYEYYYATETALSSGIFFSSGIDLSPVWNGLGTIYGGGYQLSVNNGKIEAFNEDSIYVRYNDTDIANDITFDTMEVTDTQVFNGADDSVDMFFINKDESRVTAFGADDFVGIEVIDPDQNENPNNPDIIRGYWDGGQNYPFGPENYLNPSGEHHAVNDLFGLENVCATGAHAKIYVLNPSNGKWCAMELEETGNNTGVFRSTTKIPLQVRLCPEGPANAWLAKAGEKLVAVYQDPSNHSDSAWISIKVSERGSVPAEGTPSETDFTDATGTSVAEYTEGDSIYVKVVDEDHIGEESLEGCLTIAKEGEEGATYGLTPLTDAENDYTFITDEITMEDLDVGQGDTITAKYTDPYYPITDTSSDTATIVGYGIEVEEIHVGPNNPFDPTVEEAEFSFTGSGVADTFSVTIYDLSGKLVFEDKATNVTNGEVAVTWDGTDDGVLLANGPYHCVIVIEGTDEEENPVTETQRGTVFINR